jgi:hypothetical protein
MIKALRLVIAALALLTVVASCSKEEPVPVNGLTLNRTMLTLAVGMSKTLDIAVTPDNAADKTVTWTSSNPEVASIDNGVVTALAEGTAIIIAFTPSGKTATCAVTVKSQFLSIEFTGTPVDNSWEATVRTIRFGITAKSFVVDWGDGSIEEYNNFDRDFAAHIYENRAEYTVRILRAEEVSYFRCDNQRLTALEIINCPSLTELYCYNNHLSILDANNCTTLTELYCSNNQLSALNIGDCTALELLFCGGNKLSALDVSGCTALEKLRCSDNQLSVLDVSGYVALKELWCANNQLSTLNISSCTALEWLWCSDNQLSVLDVSGCAALNLLRCETNQLSATALNDVFTGLPDHSDNYSGSIYIRNNPGSETSDLSIAINKNWKINPLYF